MDLSKLSNEELLKIANIKPKSAEEVSKETRLSSTQESEVRALDSAPIKDYKSDFDKNIYFVKLIKDKHLVNEWLLYKHYAHRCPSISYAYGLYIDNKIEGVITFGLPPTPAIQKLFKPYNILELNRLVVNDNLPKNSLSYFVSQAINQLPKPLFLISFSDPNHNHHGYIYQATNWIYTGLSEKGGKNKNYILNGIDYHGRWINPEWFIKNNLIYDNNKTITENFILNGGEIKEQKQKHRYYYIIANKKDKKIMKELLLNKYKSLPYPKGNNMRYDTSYEIKNLKLNRKGIEQNNQEKREKEDRQVEKKEEDR